MPRIQHKPEGSPNAKWTISRLCEYIHHGLSEILQAGRYTAARTYRIGRALFYARKKVPLGWNKWLEDQGINRQVAWEAVKLYEAVKSEDDLTNLTVTEAKIKYGVYSEFSKKPPPSSGTTTPREIYQSEVNGSGKAPNQDPAHLVNLMFSRSKGAAEAVSQIEWTAEMLYLIEVDETISYCQKILEAIEASRERIKRPERQVDTSYLDQLDAT